MHWSWFRSPQDVDPENVVRGFFPVVRLSRRFIEMFSRKAEKWEGHPEALYPSMALHAGLTLEDMGGDGPMTKPSRRGKVYSNTRAHQIDAGTFRVYPPVDTHYFPNRTEAVPANLLWHPVKTEAHKAKRRRRAATTGGIVGESKGALE